MYGPKRWYFSIFREGRSPVRRSDENETLFGATTVGTFSRTLVRIDGRLLIESKCTECGEWRVVSTLDGSRDEWETGHTCEAEAASNQPSQSP
jgi:hypothetical protein